MSDEKPPDAVSVGIALPSYGPFADPQLLVDIALEAEELGVDSLWLPDHLLMPTAPPSHLATPWEEVFTFAAFLLARVGARVGSDVVVLPYRSPFTVAKMAMQLAQLSAGRFALGVGCGYIDAEFDLLGVPFSEAGRRTDEMLDIMRRLWTGQPTSFNGQYWRFEDAVLQPVVPPPTVLVGGNSLRAVRRAARFGDGWHPLGLTPELYGAGASRLAELWGDVGRPGTPTLSYSSTFVRIEGADREPCLLGGWYDRPEKLAVQFRSLRDLGVSQFVVRLCPAPREVDPGLRAMRHRMHLFMDAVWPLVSRLGEP